MDGGDVVLAERRGPALVLTFNRPEKLNAISTAMLRELERGLDDAERDGTVRAVILTGAGDRAFVAGADIGEYAGGEHDGLLDAAMEKAEAMAKVAPLSSIEMLRLVRTAFETSLEEGLDAEHDALFHLHRTADAAEGIRAFEEKRDPRFTGT